MWKIRRNAKRCLIALALSMVSSFALGNPNFWQSKLGRALVSTRRATLIPIDPVVRPQISTQYQNPTPVKDADFYFDLDNGILFRPSVQYTNSVGPLPKVFQTGRRLWPNGGGGADDMLPVVLEKGYWIKVEISEQPLNIYALSGGSAHVSRVEDETLRKLENPPTLYPTQDGAFSKSSLDISGVHELLAAEDKFGVVKGTRIGYITTFSRFGWAQVYPQAEKFRRTPSRAQFLSFAEAAEKIDSELALGNRAVKFDNENSLQEFAAEARTNPEKSHRFADLIEKLANDPVSSLELGRQMEALEKASFTQHVTCEDIFMVR